MQSVPTDLTSYTSYTDMLFPDITQECVSLSSIASTAQTSPEVLDWVVNTRQNYQPWCLNLQDLINTAKGNVVDTLTQALGEFTTIAQEIEWGYNMITVILTNKGCTQDVIDSYTSTFGSNATVVLSQAQYWSSSVSYMSGSIPGQVTMGFYQQFQYVFSDPTVISPLKMLKMVS